MIRVLLVDDQPLVRAGLASIFEMADGIEVVGQCADGSEVAAAAAAHEPDVVVMDVRMKDVDGAEATRRLRATGEAPPVLVLTTFDDDDVVAAALGAGASGFLLKDAPHEDLVRAVEVVASGDSWLDPSITTRVLAAYRDVAVPRAAEARRLDDVTPRERDVLALMARGSTNQEIAADLAVSEATVKSHVGHLFSKLGVRDRAGAIVWAYDHGLVEPGGGAGPTT